MIYALIENVRFIEKVDLTSLLARQTLFWNLISFLRT